jgi:glycosyltransferase involved in cell wall biosynthesis
MKICILARTVNLSAGGVGRFPKELTRNLEQRGHEVKVVALESKGLYKYFLDSFVLNRLKIPPYFNIYHSVSPMEAFSLPHFRSVSTILDIATITHPEMLGAGLDSPCKMKLGRRIFRQGVLTALKATKVTCISEDTKTEVERVFGYNRLLEVIKLGIREDLEPRPRTSKEFTIGYLGQLDPRKRLDTLIEAFKVSRADKLIIGGKGRSETYLKTLGDDRVLFKGYVIDEDLRDFYTSLDLFVFPSKIEGYGLPIVEAMACKIPVIVMQDSIIPWELKSRCIIVDDLRYVLGNKKYLLARINAMDLQSNYEFAKSHSWDKCTDEYLKVYKDVLDG